MRTFVRSTRGVILVWALWSDDSVRHAAFAQSNAPKDSSASEAAFVLEHLEAPREIGLGTVAVNVWTRVASPGQPLSEVTLVTRRADGSEELLSMKALDGAFDSPIEEAVATLDTFAWIEEGSHEFEIRARSATELGMAGKGAMRVKKRIASPDLFVVDEFGVAHSWIGSGAGGFTPIARVEAGAIAADPHLADVDGDRLLDLIVPAEWGEVRTFRNKGAGRFEAGVVLHASPDLVDACVSDLDGDGRADLVTASTERTLEIRIGLAEEAAQVSSLVLAPDRIEICNLHGDSFPEIAIALLGIEEAEVQIWQRDGETKTWLPGKPLEAGSTGRGRVRDLAPLATTHERKQDLLVLSQHGNGAVLECWSGSADTKSESDSKLEESYSFAGSPLRVVSARLKAHAPESWFVVTKDAEGATIWTRGRAAAPLPMARLAYAPEAIAVLDLDGDGDDDVVTAAEELELWINVEGRSLQEAGESPYPLDAVGVALVSGNLDER
jgi:hypothetical protein